ncbi:MAG: zinc ribbon domain-containing protein, partial [Candidatus Sulfotelmatobacter sp.]
MAQPTDEPNVRILPDPELNPLLNPLLGAHMGRWAEVYFTTPPEKRAQAVSELVRELMKNPTPDNVTAQRNNDERMLGRLEDLSEQAEVSGPSVEEATLICENCGHNNSALQRFCGMCGSPLTLAPESDQQQVAEAAPLAVARWDAPEPPIPGGPNPSERYSDADFISRGENFTASESSTLFSTEASPVEFRSLSQY